MTLAILRYKISSENMIEYSVVENISQVKYVYKTRIRILLVQSVFISYIHI